MVRFLRPLIGAAALWSQIATAAPTLFDDGDSNVVGAAVIITPGSSSAGTFSSPSLNSGELGSSDSLGSDSLGSSSLGSLSSSSLSSDSLGSSSFGSSLGSSSLGSDSLGSENSLGSDSLGSGSLGSDSLGSDSLGSNSLGSSLGSDSLGSSSLGSDSLGSSSLGSSSLGSSSLGSSSLGSSSLGSSSLGSSLGSSSLGSSSLGSSSLGSLGSSSLGSSSLGSSSLGSSSGLQFGSGSSSFNAAGFGTCVAQCVSEFGVPSSSSLSGSSSGSSFDPTSTSVAGTGVTQTIIVAPTLGVLRFVPFAINASVGDTVRFIWGAGPHTVTKSSELTVCNATLDAPFNSGRQNASFIFDQTVTDTDPTFFFCGVPTHCQKGMFGIINPPTTFSADLSIGGSIAPLIAANPALEAAVNQGNLLTAGTSAANWGTSISLQGIPAAAQEQMVENLLYTQMFYAANPGALELGLGASTPSGGPLNIPPDPSQLVADAAASSPAAATATTAPLNSGARSVGANALFAVVSAAAAAFFAL